MNDFYYALIGAIIGLVFSVFNSISKEKRLEIEEKFIGFLNGKKHGNKIVAIYYRLKGFIVFLGNFLIQLIVTFQSYLTDLGVRRVIKSPVLRILFSVTIYIYLFWYCFLIYFHPSLETLGILKSIFKFSLSDKAVTDILDTLIKIIQILLPLSITFYIFTYREHKTVSESSSNNVLSKIPLILFIEIALLDMIYGLHLKMVISQNSPLSGLSSTQEQFGRLIIWLILFGITIYLAIITVRNLIRNINIKWLFNDTIEKTQRHFYRLPFSLPYKRFKKLRERIYDELNTYIESIYQMLNLTIEKNMDNTFHDGYAEWEKQLLRFQERLISLNNDNSISYIGPVKTDPEKFTALYRSILKNHIVLISSLYKKHKIEEVHNCINTIFKMNPREKELYPIYLTALQELAVYLYDNDLIGIRPLLKGLEQLCRELDDEDRTGVVLIYKELVIRASNENDVKLLSDLFFSLTKLSQGFRPINKNVNIMMSSFLNSTMDGESINKAIIFILFQSALKCIELPNYTSVGFLLKFVVTNFDSRLLKNVFEDFVARNARNNPYLVGFNKYIKLNGSFNFNEKTIEYCMNKLIILLLGQQKYVLKHNIDFGFVPSVFISPDLIKCNYVEYLIGKFEKAKSKYGLMFLEDPDFMNELKKEFIS
ncbi:hypothetical protein [Brevibacillus sp. HD1.4A]|uniref:hypothetical protein n=1 Tax=Brevibacillus sp. HD1.4A TaxID=2738978 RepID=UPI00156B828F|nr:hypothetical protein [Brevibacillus sp. HD1.4A]NRQ54501.1 hypothetical protein [Brevibacillus sp. HD1.4A]